MYFYKYLDKGLLEILGPFGIYKLFYFLNKKIINIISSYIYIYIYILFLFYFINDIHTSE